MARIVILSFDDNSAAERYVRDVVGDEGVSVRSEDPDLYTEYAKATVEAVIAQPTRPCRCAVVPQRGRRRGKRETGWVRSRHFGWWICVRCNKPTKEVIKHFITGMLHGCNDLLPEILKIGPPVTPHQRWLAEGGNDNVESHHNIPQRTEF